ncbi:MAG: Fe-S cluster assembly protein SufD, partial [Gemmatimonadetes bacterium]|nr:Fe-S cluster assembly protein SufD [Gemmatimonadota bacterium]
RDEVEILSTRRNEPEWLREQRFRAQEVFASTPMPDTRPEEWRYTPIAQILKLDALGLADEARPVTEVADLPEGVRALVDGVGDAAGRIAQVNASVAFRELADDLARQGVIFTSLDLAVQEHGELVRKHFGSGVTPEEGKFAALNSAYWTGGTFLYVPKNVRVEMPFRTFRWLSGEQGSVFGRTLVVAEEGSEVSLVEDLGSADFEAQTLSVGAVEIVAIEGAKVNYVAVQRFGRGVLHLTTDRLLAGRDARISTLYLALGSDVTRADIQCKLQNSGAHVDILGLYIADGTQHIDHETMQDHIAPHASSNLLFKGALRDAGRSVFRGLIRVHPKAQRTDAYQTNRNLILSADARADSLPNLEIGADDVRCSHAATIGQLDEEEIFYLLSRGIRKPEAIRLVVFGFFAEVLDQFPLAEVKKELVGVIEHKLFGKPAVNA